MNYDVSGLAVGIFIGFVVFVLALSFYLARKGSSSKSYFAAGGEINWAVNGVAFAGDYLSAASFLGICGMIAMEGYDGFLYSIGYLAGWIVAMFVVAEPMKRLGKFTFADALDSKFNSKGIQLMAGISTLVVSIFYLIPQMVGAGVLIVPLLGWPYLSGVIIVGVVVIIIVSTAGMKSTTYVQFLKGGLLIIFSTILVGIVLFNGFKETPDNYHQFVEMTPIVENGMIIDTGNEDYQLVLDDMGTPVQMNAKHHTFVLVNSKKHPQNDKDHADLETNFTRWWELKEVGAESKTGYKLIEALTVAKAIDKNQSKQNIALFNGLPKEDDAFFKVGHAMNLGSKKKLKEGEVAPDETGPLSIFNVFRVIENSDIIQWKNVKFTYEDYVITCSYQKVTKGSDMLRPGQKFSVDPVYLENGDLDKKTTALNRMNFISLMLALFFGTAALPHVLIRYYTVPTPSAARKSTIVAIVAIGFFYVLTMYMGFGAMFNGSVNVESSNMSAPLLAQHFNTAIFGIISAIAFATVLGTVSGLITASSGAIAHDLAAQFMGIKMTDKSKVMIGKVSAVVVGIIAMLLGWLFQGMNVSFLVGWAFAVAASANLPSILMLLFWKKTTAAGIVSSISTGIVSAMTIILISPQMMEKYGFGAEAAPFNLDNPAIISIPLSFLALIIASLLTQKKEAIKVAKAAQVKA